MLEQYCHETLRNACRDIVYNHSIPLVRLKTDKAEYSDNPYKDFLGEYHYLYMRSVYDWGRGKRSKSHNLCRKYFDENSINITFSFFCDLYNGKIENAMNQTGCFKYLKNEFQSWFDNKRKEFRMTFDITDSKKQILENGKHPNSHGGVANLLKVLTNTMKKQGTSIENIAKVQYTICMQAGIYIPDEFIEDVAVALHIEGDNNAD